MNIRRSIVFVGVVAALAGGAILTAGPASAEGGLVPFTCGKSYSPPTGPGTSINFTITCKTADHNYFTNFTIKGTLSNHADANLLVKIEAMIGGTYSEAVAKYGESKSFTITGSDFQTPTVVVCTPSKKEGSKKKACINEYT